MRSTDLEAWVLRVVYQVLNNHPNEDSNVELKTEWPHDSDKIAWQIGGHANVARGEAILWIIGIDEKQKRVVGAETTEVSNWYPKIEGKFGEGIAPVLVKVLSVPYEGKTLAALLFETDRAPYVVKNPGGGKFSLGVPYRKSNSNDCAKRSDLIRLLAPLQKLPHIEIIEIKADFHSLVFDERIPRAGTLVSISLTLDLYITPSNNEPVFFPLHRISSSFVVPNLVPHTDFDIFDDCEFTNTTRSTEHVELNITSSTIVIKSPARLSVVKHVKVKLEDEASMEAILNPASGRFNLSLSMTGVDEPILIKEPFDLKPRFYRSFE